MTKKNWGIVGAGWIAREMAQALHAVNGEIYAATASKLENAQRFAKEFHVQKAYGSIDELLEDPRVDIVYIATPHSLHYEQMKKALEAGKHVLCEKAITVSSRQLEECVSLAQTKNLVISDGMTILHMPLYRKLKEIVDSGAIGQVKMVQVNFGSCKPYDSHSRFFDKHLAGGALLDIGVYACSFARWFMKSQPNVILTTANYFETGVDETSGILLKNPDQQMAVIALTMRAKQPKRGVVAGDKGYIEVDEYPRADRAVIHYTEDGSSQTILAGKSEKALEYEVQDMQRYVDEKDGSQNLSLIRDVMEIVSSVRNQWGMIYPFESLND